MQQEFDYIIVGAGLCGLVLARELSKKNKKVLILEKGPFLNKLGTVMRAFFFYDKHALAKSNQGVYIYRVFGVGGTSIVSCGNAVEFSDEEYNKIGINFRNEVAEAKRECFVKDNGSEIGKVSAKIMQAANKLDYDMHPMPKFNRGNKCVPYCGNCVVGCNYKLKWTSRDCLEGIDTNNVHLVTNFSVKKVINSNGNAVGIEGSRSGLIKQRFFAEKIILSAGGVGTPVILQNSGIEAGDNLFVDLFNLTYGKFKNCNQVNELPMSAVCVKFHKSDGFVISPFVDNIVSFSSNVIPRYLPYTFRLNNLMGIMTKIADDSSGKVYKNGRIDKAPTKNDIKKLKKGNDISKEILINCGVNPKSLFVTKARGAHPGGTAGIGRVVDKNLETKMKNLYVCDCSVLPFAPGLPPILVLITLAKWFSKNVLGK
jgi:choline dehydrogenase-like flavoprotein